jgi:hypothetical protein
LRKDSLEEENEDHWFFGDDVDDPKYVSSIEEDNELFIKMLADEMKIVCTLHNWDGWKNSMRRVNFC